MGGVSMGYLDFTPEPPAPSATPVTEHVDLNLGHSHDTRDLSSKYFWDVKNLRQFKHV